MDDIDTKAYKIPGPSQSQARFLLAVVGRVEWHRGGALSLPHTSQAREGFPSHGMWTEEDDYETDVLLTAMESPTVA